MAIFGLCDKSYKKVDSIEQDEHEYDFVDLVLGMKTKKLKQPGVEELYFKMLVKNMSWKLMGNMVLNIGLSSLIIPLMFKLFNDNLLGNSSSIQLGFRNLFRQNGYKVYLVDEFRTSCRSSKCEIGE